ncbi:MAG: hypothetical protein DHS20C15_03120 [Planctomycetota bacterium]|nr:MAG: hypothetical protein DHS20C15_03120 [Planctomycetota bacterium]
MPDLIDIELLRQLTRLARLGVSPDEAEALAEDVAALLAHFESIASVEIDDAPESSDTPANAGSPAVDEATLWPQPQDTLLSLSAHTQDGFYAVPTQRERTEIERAPPASGAARDDDEPQA